MAQAVDFDQANATLDPAKGDEGRVYVLRVYKDAEQCVSCWQLSPEEITEVIKTGRLYLFVLGHRHPPVCIMGRDPWTGPPGDFIPADKSPASEEPSSAA